MGVTTTRRSILEQPPPADARPVLAVLALAMAVAALACLSTITSTDYAPGPHSQPCASSEARAQEQCARASVLNSLSGSGA